METERRVHIHETCIVPYRTTSAGIEFCLVTPVAENRWSFPKTVVDPQQFSPQVSLNELVARIGLHGQVHIDDVLGGYEASRGDECRSMIGYLMQVVRADDLWPQQSSYKRRWCLAEEARVRIRRKPLRRFIDLALHSIDADGRLLPLRAAALQS